MADIPVEKESGSKTWLWILGLILLGLIIWGLWAWIADGEEPGVAADDEIEQQDEVIEGAADTAAAGGVITDATTLFQAESRRDLVGREVRLSNMHVRGVPGDSVFYVSPQEGMNVEPGNRVIVAGLDEVIPAQPEGVEGRYEVTEGQTVTLYGSVKAIQQEQPDAWGLSAQEGESMLQQEQIYVRVQQLQITEAPEGANSP